MRHSWRDNLRELRNAIEQVVILCEGGVASGAHQPIAIAASTAPAPASPALSSATDVVLSGSAYSEPELIEKALSKAPNTTSRAERLRGVRCGQFSAMLRQARPDRRPPPRREV